MESRMDTEGGTYELKYLQLLTELRLQSPGIVIEFPIITDQPIAVILTSTSISSSPLNRNAEFIFCYFVFRL